MYTKIKTNGWKGLVILKDRLELSFCPSPWPALISWSCSVDFLKATLATFCKWLDHCFSSFYHATLVHFEFLLCEQFCWKKNVPLSVSTVAARFFTSCIYLTSSSKGSVLPFWGIATKHQSDNQIRKGWMILCSAACTFWLKRPAERSSRVWSQNTLYSIKYTNQLRLSLLQPQFQ